jgi:hypothetical protein
MTDEAVLSVDDEIEQTPERKRLKREIEARKHHLGWTWERIAADAGLKVDTIRRVRNEMSDIQLPTRRALETGLRWKEGSVTSILSGGPPIPLPIDSAEEEHVGPPGGGGRNLWITMPGGRPVMIPIAWSRIPGLEVTTEEERAELAARMLDVMVSAGLEFLHAEGEKRAKD